MAELGGWWVVGLVVWVVLLRWVAVWAMLRWL
jgi:hypothetical protein